MARYLVYTSPARGHLYPIVPTLEELRRRGHEVVVRTLASEVELLRDLGFKAAPIDPAIERKEHADWQARTPIGALQAALHTFFERARHDGPDLRRAIEEERPDALLIDINTWGAMAAAETTGMPWATWCPYFLPVPSRDAPPFGLGLPPARGLLGRLRDRLLSPVILATYNRLAPELDAVRAELGAPPVRRIERATNRAPLLLYLTSEPFEYPRSDWPPSVRVVGPGIWDPPAKSPAWLEEIKRPLVLVTCSTEFQNDGKLVRMALKALAGEDVEVMVTTAGVDLASFTPPPNARVERFVPHRPVLERAACVVCHGGMGITQKALASGVPVCVVPFGRDQFEVARHVEVADAGTRLPASRLRPERLRSAVREAMGKKDGAERIAAAFASAGGPGAATEALEKLLNDPADKGRREQVRQPAQ
ncbi:MAG: glycosyltransferase [Actinomycetota bacterium]|nr:glycosyltransferase [Actinomycetota bacterium]